MRDPPPPSRPAVEHRLRNAMHSGSDGWRPPGQRIPTKQTQAQVQDGTRHQWHRMSDQPCKNQTV